MHKVYYNSFEEKHKKHDEQAKQCETILLYICGKTGLKKSVIQGKCRMQELAFARYAFFKYCKKKHPEIPNEIIAATVNRTTATMDNGMHKINTEIDLIKYYKNLNL